MTSVHSQSATATSSTTLEANTIPESGDTSSRLSRQHSLLYKNAALNLESTRRRNERDAVHLRKLHKDDTLNQRRVRFSSSFRETLQEEHGKLPAMQKAEAQTQKETSLEQVKNRFGTLLLKLSGDESKEAIIGIREILSNAPQPPVEEALEVGILDGLLPLLQREKDTFLLFQMVWILTNLTSGSAESTNFILTYPTISILLSLLEHRHEYQDIQREDVKEKMESSKSTDTESSEPVPSIDGDDSVTWLDVHSQVFGTLGNIAGNGSQCRRLLMEQDLPKVLTHHLKVAMATSKTCDVSEGNRPMFLSPINNLLRQCVWCLSNLSRFLEDCEEAPEWKVLIQENHNLDVFEYFHGPLFINLITDLVSRCPQEEEQLLADSCWSLLNLGSGPEERLELLLQTGITRYFLQLLVHVNPEVSMSALRLIGLLVTGDDAHTEVVLSTGLLPCLGFLLSTSRGNDRRWKQQICWVLSNITAGCKAQKQAVIDAGLMPLVLDLMNEGDFRSRREGLWVVSNLLTNCSKSQLRFVIEEINCLPPLCHLLSVHDNSTVLLALDCLKNILQADSDETLQEKYAHMWEECGGLNIVEYLQSHLNESVYAKAHDIIDRYYHREKNGEEFEAQGRDGLREEHGLDLRGSSQTTVSSSIDGETRFSF